MRIRIKSSYLVFLLVLLLFVNCGSTNPVNKIIKGDLSNVPEWSIILDDMKEEGFFSTNYFHKYKILTGNGDTTETKLQEKKTDWIEVSPRFYREKENYLGMTIASKVPNQNVSRTANPPGYQYVGNSHYGQWRQDRSGNSFWEFYGKYALFSNLLFGSNTRGIFGRRNIYRDDYDSYRGSRSNRRPYFGRKGEYGTHGTTTMKTKPSFFARKKQRIQQRKSNFSNRVKSRMGRTSRSRSSRSFGRGK